MSNGSGTTAKPALELEDAPLDLKKAVADAEERIKKIREAKSAREQKSAELNKPPPIAEKEKSPPAKTDFKLKEETKKPVITVNGVDNAKKVWPLTPFLHNIIDLPGGHVNDPSLWKHFSLLFLLTTPLALSRTLGGLFCADRETSTLSGVLR